MDAKHYLKYVRRAFRFLETEYGYQFCNFQDNTISDPRDGDIEVNYTGPKVDIRIAWYPISAGINMGFLENRKNAWSKMLNRRNHISVQGASFDDFLRMSGIDLPDLVPIVRISMGKRGWIKNLNARMAYIFEHGEEIIDALARRVEIYGIPLVRGERGIFEKVQKWLGRQPAGYRE